MDIKVARFWLLLLFFGLGIVTIFLLLQMTLSSEDSDDDDLGEPATIQRKSLEKQNWTNLENSEDDDLEDYATIPKSLEKKSHSSEDSEDDDLEDYATNPKSLEKEPWTDLADSLETGYDVIQNYPTLEEATLIMGDTGSEKTNLVQVLTGGIPLAKDKRKGVGGNSLIPELFQSNSSFFYNCPGFDIPGSDQNIATNFFLSQIVERVSHLKILFLITHKFFKTTTDLDLLAEHATNFIRNLSKYKNSIGLVVTSVKSLSKEYYIKNEIVKLLSTFNQTLHSKLASDEEGDPIARKIEFTEGLLQKDDKGQYRKISFSRFAKERSQSEFEKSEEGLITPLQGNLVATPVNPGDFGFTVNSGYATNSIRNVVERSNLEISKSVEILLEHFQSWHDTTHLELKTEVGPFLQKIRVDYDEVASLTNPELVGNISDPLKFAVSLKTCLGKVGYRTPHQFLLFMERQHAFFHFFQEAGVSPLRRDLEAWMVPINKLKLYLAKLRDWYDFISQLHLVLHSYNFQLTKTSFPARGQVPWLDYIDSNKILPVSNRVRDIAEEIHARDLNMLNSIMPFALSSTEITCSGGTLTVIGNFILLSEFIGNDGSLRGSCKILITKLEIYASHILVVDSNLRMVGEGMEVVMIAPVWDVVQEAVVDLSGTPGTNYQHRASDGHPSLNDTDGTGSEGVAGKPGGPGGSLFGIVETILNGDNLKIIYTGGQGGMGGNGGQGANGRNLVQSRHSDGLPGWNGGNGGNGGKGGLGGYEGKVKIVKLSSGTVSLNLVGGTGEIGTPGLGGRGGFGGIKLNGMGGVRVRDCRSPFSELPPICVTIPSTSIRVSNGSRGLDNMGTQGRVHPKPYKYSIIEWRTILHFKYTLFPIHLPQIVRCRRLMEGAELIEESYTVKAYIEELLLLERMSIRNDAPVEDLYSAYKSCINRMEAYIERKKEVVTLSEKKVLALALASAYSKLVSLDQSRLGQDLGIVVDVSQYFSYLKEELAKLRSASASLTISEENVAYGENIMVKVGQIQEFISGVVTPALNSAEEEIRFRLTSLVTQFKKMLEEAEEHLEEMKKLLERERATLWLNAIFGVFQLATQVFGGLDPTGTVKMVGAGVSLAKGVLDSSSKGGGGLQFGSTLGQVRNMYTQASEVYNVFSGTKSNSSESQGEGDDQDQKAMKSFQRKEALLTLGEGAAYLYDKYKSDKVRLSRLEAAVREAEMIVQDVTERKEAMEKNFVPVVQSMLSYFKNLQSHLEGGSREQSLPAGELDITKWQVSRALKSVKADLEGLSSGIRTTEFVRAIDSIQDALTMMIDLYNNIEKYQNEKNLADYLTKVSSASLNSVQISDSELAASVSKLYKVTRENLLRREYLRGMHALKQWVFPFAKLHLTQFQSNLDLIGDNDLVDVYLAQIEMLDSQLKKYKATTLSAQDTYIFKTIFSSEHRSSRPFYVWKNDKFRTEIGRLLSGEEVHFYADLRQSLEGRDAVKFSQIEINFKFAEGVEPISELGEELRYFSVSMTHSGISPYRFQGEVYVMSGTNQTIRYNFERDSKGSRLATNLIYRKFEEGDFLLSPYTLWTFQLSKAVSSDETVNFYKLQKFVDLVDLELVGTGVYVDGSSKLNVDLEMQKYYVSEGSFWSA